MLHFNYIVLIIIDIYCVYVCYTVYNVCLMCVFYYNAYLDNLYVHMYC